MFCSTFLQALEKYESNPEDVGEAFQEWVSKNEKKKKNFDYQDFATKVLRFFLFLSSSFSFIFFFTSLTKWTKCVNCISTLKISLSSWSQQPIKVEPFPYQSFWYLIKSLRLINSRRLNPCILSHYFKNFNLKPYNRFTDRKVLYVLIAVKLSLIRRIKSLLM